MKGQGATQNSHKGLSVHQETVRFEELYARLLRSKQLNKKTQMLHVMLELAGNGVPPSERGNAAQKQGTVLQSVFQSKLANQVSYNEQKGQVEQAKKEKLQSNQA